ncbi:hypothetical protein EVAR_29883_1 [Eumeta japonica]|uniref:Uncharacterized protein n=1 Tax=Eumeta variegata TaxID=151549 RepID=A0A4C1V6L5_EUMVA|nr:hypothetical protein EVAR_29883_1 [Eumeta japonica]
MKTGLGVESKIGTRSEVENGTEKSASEARTRLGLTRDQCVTGSWKTTEALALLDLVAMKKIGVVRIQNRRPHVDGEYLYACRYWRSSEYNRKGKYAIIGGSGTESLEIVNLHNRYITCSYPAPGAIFAVTSHEEKIAFGGSAPFFNMVSFHDPKHERYGSKLKERSKPILDMTNF